MILDSETIIPMSDANRNFSKVVHTVDEKGMAVIMKNNKPRYVILDFEEYEPICSAVQMRKELIDTAADSILEENMEAFLELAK